MEREKVGMERWRERVFFFPVKNKEPRHVPR